MIPVQPSQLPNRVSFLNENRTSTVDGLVGVNASGVEAIWDREINDNQFDHFGDLMKSAADSRVNKD